MVKAKVFHELQPIVGPSFADAVFADNAANSTIDIIFLIVYGLGNSTLFLLRVQR
jgi:hypothetical protein